MYVLGDSDTNFSLVLQVVFVLVPPKKDRSVGDGKIPTKK